GLSAGGGTDGGRRSLYDEGRHAPAQRHVLLRERTEGACLRQSQSMLHTGKGKEGEKPPGGLVLARVRILGRLRQFGPAFSSHLSRRQMARHGEHGADRGGQPPYF